MSKRVWILADCVVTFATIALVLGPGGGAWWTTWVIAAGLFWNYVAGARRIYRP